MKYGFPPPFQTFCGPITCKWNKNEHLKKRNVYMLAWSGGAVCTRSTSEVETGKARVRGQPGLYSEALVFTCLKFSAF
jgi:hypothetical protein